VVTISDALLLWYSHQGCPFPPSRRASSKSFFTEGIRQIKVLYWIANIKFKSKIEWNLNWTKHYRHGAMASSIGRCILLMNPNNCAQWEHCGKALLNIPIVIHLYVLSNAIKKGASLAQGKENKRHGLLSKTANNYCRRSSENVFRVEAERTVPSRSRLCRCAIYYKYLV